MNNFIVKIKNYFEFMEKRGGVRIKKNKIRCTGLGCIIFKIWRCFL